MDAECSDADALSDFEFEDGQEDNVGSSTSSESISGSDDFQLMIEVLFHHRNSNILAVQT